jgi:hypothetical protein
VKIFLTVLKDPEQYYKDEALLFYNIYYFILCNFAGNHLINENAFLSSEVLSD